MLAYFWHKNRCCFIFFRAVLAAMRKGDAAKAEELRRANIRNSREYLERFQNFVL